MMLAPPRAHARAMFSALVESSGNDLPLDQCAAWIQAEEQGLSEIAPILTALEQFSENLHVPSNANIFECVARINHHMFVEHGFSGNPDGLATPDASLLGEVLERKNGQPILLSLIYMEISRRHGVQMDGIGFPTHFLVQPHEADPVFFVDPFHQGRVLRMDQLRAWFERIVSERDLAITQLERWLHPIPSRLVLLRMNQDLKAVYMQRGDLEGALRAVERMLILMPDSIDVRRDRGLLRIELGQEEEGAKDLDAYLAAQKKRHVVRAQPLDE